MRHFHPMQDIADYFDTFSDKTNLKKGGWAIESSLYSNENLSKVKFHNKTKDGRKFYLLFILKRDCSISFNKIIVDQSTLRNNHSRRVLRHKLEKALNLNLLY